MPQIVSAPTRIPVPGGKVIDEYVGAINTPDAMLGDVPPGGQVSVSVAHMVAPAHWAEPYQTPEFAEITLVLRGTVLVDHDGGRLEASAGQAVISAPGERLRYSTGDDEAEYVAVCLPAFRPDTAHRDDV